MTKGMKRIKHALRVPFEWIGIGVLMCVIPWLPRKGLFALCDFLSAVMYCLDRRGKRRALENLHIILGRASGTEGTKAYNPRRVPYHPTAREALVIRRSYRNMARTVGYAFWTCVCAKSRCAQTGVMSPAARRFYAENRSAVAVSGHIGCWEILSQLVFLEGRPLMSVAKSIGSGGITALLMRARRSIGQEIVLAEGASMTLLKGLREGKVLGLLVDQKVSPKKGGIWIRFFGKPMPVSAAPAFFAARGGIPVMVGRSRSLRDGRYSYELVDEISAAEARDIWGTTQRIAADLERIIRRHPSCWVLNYNYFRQVPTAEELAELVKRESKRKG